MTPHEMSVICRFSRNGVVPWQAVAAILGRNAASLRAEFDSLSMEPALTLDPPGIGPIEALPEPECYRSTRDRGPGLRMTIIATLVGRKMSAETIAGLTATGIKSIRVRLSQLQADGVVEHDSRMPYAWSLTDYGREVWARERRARQSEGRAA